MMNKNFTNYYAAKHFAASRRRSSCYIFRGDMRALLSALPIFLAASASGMEIACNSPEYYLERSDVVFEGVVINREYIDDQPEDSLCWSIEKGSKCGSKVATIAIETVHKGKLKEGDETTVYAGDGCYCVDPYLEKGLKYIVYAKKDGNRASYYSFEGCATKQTKYNQAGH